MNERQPGNDRSDRLSVWARPSPCRRAGVGLCLLLAACGQATESTSSAKPADLTQLPLEALMEIEVPKVYGASKFEQRATEAPASVTVVTADEVKKYGYRTLADVLQSAQGFNVSYDRNYAFLGTRGLSLGDFNARMFLLVDGHRVNNNFNDGAAIGTDFVLDVDLIDHVEIIRGPGSVLYGNNAFFGVINVVTRKGQQLNGVEASAEYGSFDTYQARVSYGQIFTNGVQLVLSGTYSDSGGQDRLYYKEFDYPAQNRGVAQNLDGDTSGSFYGSLGYSDFTLAGAFDRREKANPTGQYSVTNTTAGILLTDFNDSRLRTTDERGYCALKYAHSFPDVVDVTAQVSYDRYTHEIGYPYSVLVGNTLIPSDFSTEKDIGEWWGAELQLTKRLWDQHVLTLGGEYRDDFHQEQRNSGQDPRLSSRQSYGVYAQGDFAVRTNLHLIAGVRYDQYGEFDPSANPRVALIYNPWEKSTLKAIYGTAFRAPSFYEDTLKDPGQVLHPEKITSYELVYEQDLGRHLRSSVSGFYNQMDDLLVFGNGGFANFNAQTKGVELALEGFWPSGLRGRASYSFQDTRDNMVAWDVPDSPNHLLKLNLSAPLVRDKLFAGVEFQYASNRRSLHNTTLDNQPITVQGEQAGGFGVVNLTLFSQKLVKDFEFSASVYNVLDRRYSDPASSFHVQDLIGQDRRSFRLKLTYRF